MKSHSWSTERAAERRVDELPRGGEFSLALAYANSYHVGMSSLALHRVYELVHRCAGWTCERFFCDGEGPPQSVESSTPLSRFGCVAFSVSFEEDYVLLLQMLDRAGIALRRAERRPSDPLIVMGGACAAINPIPMSEFVNVFILGAAENVLPDLLAALEECESGAAVEERLAERPGFYVPSHHHYEDHSGLNKLRKLELTEAQMRQAGNLPTTAILTPYTEFADKFLVEMSRGCPEKCRYCWATFGMGTFRWHPTDFILESFARARPHTEQLGFVATAVGDHPEIERILAEAGRLGFRSSVSSIRIPAVTDVVLELLHASGDRSITLAPETGTDEMRAKMGKPVSNATLLEKVRMIFRHGFTQLKLYFIIGLPDETPDDVVGIVDLVAECRSIMIEEARRSGVIGHIHLGANVLVPKPYTPWQREPLADRRSLEHKISILRKGVAALPNVSLGSISIRQAKWQTYITKAGAEAAVAIERVARGESLASILRDPALGIDNEVYQRMEGDLRWHFMRTG